MNTDQRRVSAVIFDMDGLMLDTERVNLWAWQQAMADQGLAAPAELYVQTIGLTDADTDAVLQAALGDEALVQVIRAGERRHMAAFLTENGIPVKAGLLELLELLDDLSLPRAVASSRERASVEGWLQAAGLRKRLDALVGGDEVPQGKPAPDIFLMAASHLGVPPSQCLVLEDSEAGIQAAQAAGMTPILVPDLKAPTPTAQALAHRVMPSLHEVRAYVRALAGDHDGSGKDRRKR